MKNNKKVAAVVITAVAITGSATALANASGSKMKSVSNTKVTTVSRTFNVNGMGNMGGMRGPAGHVSTVLADLVTKGTITAAESKAVTDAWDALEAAEHAAGATKTPPTTPPTPGQISPELTQALKDLVSKGTLTQAKSDAITAAVKAAEAAEQANRPAMPNGPMGGGFQNSNKEAIITSTLGIDAATLKSRLQAGDSLATIAGAKKDALIAALVADETKQIDAAVTAGKLTAAQATTIKADLTAHVTAEVNATGPMGGFGGKGGHGHGGPGGHGGGMGMPNGSKNGIPSTTTTSTTAN